MAGPAWGLAWGLAWGNAWGVIAGYEQPTPPTPEPGRRQGRGSSSFWIRHPYKRIRRKAIEVIEEVAQRQVQDTRLDDTQKVQELMAELEAQKVSFDKRYLQALQARREFLIDEEIAQRMREVMKKRNEEEEAIIFMILNQLQ